MFLGARTAQRLRMALLILGVYAALVVAMAFWFPRTGDSFESDVVWWLVALPVSACLYVALEWFGTWLLERPLFNRRSSLGRILMFVGLVGLVVLVLLLCSRRF